MTEKRTRDAEPGHGPSPSPGDDRTPREDRRASHRPTRRREQVIQHDRGASERRDSAPGNPDRYPGPLRRRDDPPGGGVGGLPGEAYYGEVGHHTTRNAGAYRRSDESIQEEICELLTHHPDVNAGEIEVLVEGGEVTLQGSVEQRDARWLIEELVESVSGVSLVHNRVRIAKR